MHKNPSGRLGACVCEDCETGVHLSCTTAAPGGGKGHAGQGKGDYKGIVGARKRQAMKTRCLETSVSGTKMCVCQGLCGDLVQGRG